LSGRTRSVKTIAPPIDVQTKSMKYSAGGMMPQVSPMLPPAYCATELASSQTPMKSDAKRAGASLVTMERPTGDRQSSPSVAKRELRNGHSPLARGASLFFPSAAGGSRHAGGAPADPRSASVGDSI